MTNVSPQESQKGVQWKSQGDQIVGIKTSTGQNVPKSFQTQILKMQED